MKTLNLTPKQELFLERLMDQDVHPNHITFIPIVQKVLQHKLATEIFTVEARELAESILFEIYSVKFTEELENTLTQDVPEYKVANKEKATAKKNKISTKRLSYDEFMKNHADSADATILSTLKKYPDLSRRELATYTNMFLCTVTGCVTRLMDAGYIVETGTKVDKDTNRRVATIKVNNA